MVLWELILDEVSNLVVFSFNASSNFFFLRLLIIPMTKFPSVLMLEK